MLWSGSQHGDLSEGKVRWIVKECGDPQLDRIPTDYVDRAVMKLRAAGKAPGTINRYLSALHAVLGWGAKPGRRLVPVMPEFSWQDEDEGRIRYLTSAKRTASFEHCGPWATRRSRTCASWLWTPGVVGVSC
jgi:hypothetical protein